MPDDGIELGRRVHQRFAIAVEARVTTDEGAFDAVTRDVSRGGVCLLVQTPMAVGTSFEIALSLVLGENTFSEPLVLVGRVVWCTQTAEGFQIGASFERLDAAKRDYLQMFLSLMARGVDVGQEDAVEDEDDEEGDTEEKGLFA